MYVKNDTQCVMRECGDAGRGHLRECDLEGQLKVLTSELRTREIEQDSSMKNLQITEWSRVRKLSCDG